MISEEDGEMIKAMFLYLKKDRNINKQIKIFKILDLLIKR